MCPGSHVRRVRGVTPGRESPDVKVPDGPAVSVDVGWFRGRASLGAAASSERCSVVNRIHQELPFQGVLKASCGEWERRARVAWAKASVCGEAIGHVHPQGSPAYGRWHQGKDRWLKAGKVCVPAKTRPVGKDPAYNRKAGSRREGRRLAAEAVGAMTARTTQPRSSQGPLGERGRCFGEGPGVVPYGAITRRGVVPVRATRLHGRTTWHGEGGRPTRAGAGGSEGRVGAPTVRSASGNAVAETRSLAAGLGKTQRPVDRGAGGNQRQSAKAARRQAPPAYPTAVPRSPPRDVRADRSTAVPLSQAMRTPGARRGRRAADA